MTVIFFSFFIMLFVAAIVSLAAWIYRPTPWTRYSLDQVPGASQPPEHVHCYHRTALFRNKQDPAHGNYVETNIGREQLVTCCFCGARKWVDTEDIKDKEQ